jgi:cytoskeletal protein CcmA (bactofilin family)
MIFRRRQDEMEGFRRMREALRQQADPQDHALLDEQYAGDEFEDEFEDEEPELVDEAAEPAEPAESGRAPAATAASQAAPLVDSPLANSLFGRPAAVMPSGATMTTIGADTSWSGTLRSESNVMLEGKIEGTVEARDTVFVAERATVDARVKALAIVVSGHLTGHIQCEGRLEITPSGRLNGEVEYGTLIVHEGAIVDGTFRMRGGPASA